MPYNPFDYIGTDKRKRVSSKLMGLAQDVIGEHKLRENIVKDDIAATKKAVKRVFKKKRGV